LANNGDTLSNNRAGAFLIIGVAAACVPGMFDTWMLNRLRTEGVHLRLRSMPTLKERKDVRMSINTR